MTVPMSTGPAGARGGVVVVTGGAGFIGTSIAPGLFERFERVIAVDSLHPQIHPDSTRPRDLDERVELVVGDVTVAETWEAVLADAAPDVVVHLAAETGTAQSLAESTRHATANVVGTTQMFDALLRADKLPRRIVLTSSRAVYGEGAWRRGNGELFYPGQRTSEVLARGEWDFAEAEPVAMRSSEVRPAPVSVYGATKLAQENLLTAWAQAVGVEPVILRLQNVYGPGQSLINPYTGIMSLFCRMAKAGRSIPLYEDGEVRRDFILIDDVAQAVLAAVDAPAPGLEPIDIGSGEHQTIARAAELIAARYGAPAPHVTGQYRQGDVRHAWSDVSLAQKSLDWTPRYTLETGIERLADWIDTQPIVPL
ncbi:NAD-dependent epimerase/dehydratase family protein [Cellulomonas chengniuliangii]|uniref:NAD-dependent epimerase/dehydratase family protein n=1 Tax=Cellulomonas chengniuliangii TaxID=2968084 RepID=A0ABY5KXT8_9CELL|nr:NAD-dependent epimerase/dehydratase family protein [Cellulomonas chengniuliangii]MCC2308741.1 NAD-dependent epimerase/dehydratase family protein [Cellulomonas chengniuliangii]UUI74508.1 NAD-dependent epimerase/dehydratase family protein [Cellulomonas chengniuliangii]